MDLKVGDFGLAREGAEYKMELEDDFGDRKKVVACNFFVWISNTQVSLFS